MNGKDIFPDTGGAAGASPAAVLAEVLESIGAGACIWDPDLRLAAWNAAYPGTFGLPDSVLRPGTRLAEVLDASAPLYDDQRSGAEIEAMVRQLLAERGSLDVDRVLKDGRTLAVAYHRLSTGGWIAIYHDVTERREATRKLREQSARIDAALESMPYGFSIWDENLRLVLFNRRYAEIYGMPFDRLFVGMSLKEICVVTVAAGNHPDTTSDALFDTYKERLRETTAGAIPREYEKQIRGRTIKTTYTPRPGLGCVITHEDITQDRERMDALRDREAAVQQQKLRLEAAVNNMSQGLCMFDSDRRLVICNENYARIYGLPPELMQPGTRVEDILTYRYEHGVHPAGSRQTYFDRRMALIDNRKTDVDVVELQDGRTLSVTHQPMADGGWVATHQDITEQRRNEARIRHLARHDALTDLPNRLMFRERMEGVRARIDRGEALAMLAIDLDHFKTVNDTLGHAVGDLLLKAFADRLRASCGRAPGRRRIRRPHRRVEQRPGCGRPRRSYRAHRRRAV